MKPHRLIPVAGLLAILSLAGATAVQACKYCWSGENVEAADYARQAMQAAAPPSQPPGAFPLDGAINQFQPAAPSATLSAPPAASSVVTDAADLRAARAAATKLPPAPAFTPKATAEFVPRPTTHYADAGLLSLAAAGGVFCWRTRRKTSAVR